MRKIICHGSRKLALLGIIMFEMLVQWQSPLTPAKPISLWMKMDEAHRYIDTRAAKLSGLLSEC